MNPAAGAVVAALVVAALAVLAVFVCGARAKRRADQRNYALIESIPDGVFIVDDAWRFTHINPKAEELLQTTAAEVIGRPVKALLSPLASELLPEMREARAAGLPIERRQYFQAIDTWIELHVQPAEGETIVHLRDISKRKRSEQALRTTERRLGLLLDQVPATLWTVDLDGRFTSVTGAGSPIPGVDSGELDGQPFETILADESDGERILAMLQRVYEGQSVRFETRHGSCWLQHHAEPLRAPRGQGIIGAIGVALDFTEMKETANALTHLARVDALTQLPNRLALEESLQGALRDAERSGLSIVFIDVDRFKTINDTLGHRAGDELLVEFAGRLRRAVGSEAVFRTGGDEFIVLLRTSDRSRVNAAAVRIRATFDEPFFCAGRQLRVTASFGSSTYAEDGKTSEALIAHADSAMYQAKKAGRNQIVSYDAADDGSSMRRLRLEQDLYYAIARDELDLCLDPIVVPGDERVCGAQARLRWIHTKHGEIDAAEFARVASDTAIAVEISRWMLREACARAAEIRSGENRAFRVCVNLTPRDFNEPGFVEFVVAVLAETNLRASALDIEISESVLLKGPAVERLRVLREYGVGIVVDDFGVSFGHLKNLPVTALKIDRAFIAGIATSIGDRSAVRAIVSLARTLDLAVIADGVDTPEQLRFVRDLQCDFAQGELFATLERPALEVAAIQAR